MRRRLGLARAKRIDRAAVRRHSKPLSLSSLLRIELLESRDMLSANSLLDLSQIRLSAGVSSLLSTSVQPTFEVLPQADGFSPNSFSSSSAPPFTPAQIKHAYGIDNIFFPTTADGSPYIQGDGTGQTIAIVDAYNAPNIVADLQAFDAQFGLPDPPQFTIVNQNGASSPLPANASLNGWAVETSLDVEWAHAIAPGASILLVLANSSLSSDINKAVATARDSGTGALSALPSATIVSMSYGSSSGSTNSSLYKTPVGKTGVTYLASTGDTGGNGEWPASDPNVIAVGGTTLTMSSGSVYASESGWSGSNGGFASSVSTPSYQTGVVPFGSASNPGKRMTPDVSFDANPSSGVYVYDSYDTQGSSSHWLSVGGTSFSAPAWAGLIAIADQGRDATGALTTANVHSIIYDTYSNGNYGYAFHDVTSGSNTSFSAGAGFDYVTGVGTPRADVFVSTLAGFSLVPTPTQPTGTIGTTTPTFTWSGIGAASSYRVTLVDTTTNTTILNNVSASTNSLSLGSSLTNGHGYQWTVQAYKGSTALGAASSATAFSVAVVANHSPTGTSATVTTVEDLPYTFSAASFGFTDAADNPPNSLLAVTITTLPSAGTLTLNGVPIAAGASISAASLGSGVFKFVPAANGSGTSYASFTFQVQDNGGTAGGGVDLDPTPKTMTIDVLPTPKVSAVLVDGSDWTSDFLTALFNAGAGGGGYAIPAGANQLQTLPWNNIDQIQIVFSQSVNVQQSSLTVTGVSHGAYAISDFSYSDVTHTATWTLAAPIGDDRLLIHLSSTGPSAVTGSSAAPLDGHWVDSTSVFPSGSGTPPADFDFSFNVLPGDVNRDGIINAADITVVATNWLSTGPITVDLDGDRFVNAFEMTIIASHWLNSLPAGESPSASAATVQADAPAATAVSVAADTSTSAAATTAASPAPASATLVDSLILEPQEKSLRQSLQHAAAVDHLAHNGWDDLHAAPTTSAPHQPLRTSLSKMTATKRHSLV